MIRYDGILVGNAYAFRATDPKELKRAGHPRGPGNDIHLREMLQQSTLTVAAWGANIELVRESEVLALLRAVRPVHYLILTKGGHPSHPLYKPRNLLPTELV